MCNSLWPHGMQDPRLPWPSLSPRVCLNSCLLSQWCHPTISSSVTPFSSCPQSFPASGSFPLSWFFTSGGQSIGGLSFSISPSNECSVQSVQLLSHVRLFLPWPAACQASLSITNSRSLLKLMTIESVMPSNHLIPWHPLFLLPLIFPSIRVFSTESALHIKWPKYWSFSFNVCPSNEYFLKDWLVWSPCCPRDS